MTKKTQIGTLDRRVELVSYNKAKSTTGAPEETEVSLGVVWCKIEDVSVNEDVEGQVISLAVRKYIVRWQQFLIDDGALVYIKDTDGDYNIHGFETLGRRDYLRLKTSKRE